MHTNWTDLYDIWDEYYESEKKKKESSTSSFESSTITYPVCTCGSWTQYGKQYNPLLHSDWCDLFDKSKQILPKI